MPGSWARAMLGVAAIPLNKPIDPQTLPGNVERVMGIEPTLVAWEATVLPLNYTRVGVQILFMAQPQRQQRRALHEE